ncbi:ABC transporter permease [Nocardioides sp.]|uniref:ABC transporter permease n=1 Tax=Nocardioides sp. TaxID=35761 RepID=UPI002B264DCD|nr:ABC transporter permease [Nocardioides sp.]
MTDSLRADGGAVVAPLGDSGDLGEDRPWDNPAPNRGLIEVFRRRYLLKLLVRREISARYSGSFLGLIWSYINPLSQFFIYFAIIGVIFQLHDSIPNFPIHIFSAIIVVHFFTETFNAGTRSIVRNKAIVKKMAVPAEMFPVASMLVSLYHVFPQLVILIVAVLFMGWVPSFTALAAVVMALTMIMILGTAMALLFSSANVLFRDFSSFVNILTNFVRFGVPMIYSYEMVGERFGAATPYYILNPIADAVMLFQSAFWIPTLSEEEQVGRLPDNLFALGGIMIGVSLVLLLVAQLVFSKFEKQIPERI